VKRLDGGRWGALQVHVVRVRHHPDVGERPSDVLPPPFGQDEPGRPGEGKGEGRALEARPQRTCEDKEWGAGAGGRKDVPRHRRALENAVM
jgi:hypothetical protein